MGPSSVKRAMNTKRSPSRRRRRRTRRRSPRNVPTTTNNQDNSLLVSSAGPSSDVECSTPKGERFQIPEAATCPPAPKKSRAIEGSLKRTSMAFYTSPDIELFFRLAFRRIPS
ncbi:cyclin-dependent protein kinase inhibitor SMR13-like [Andrographis paniculata]|uniref:cyclin-dependent protein kinase inhibitor SMR13-like n=1 Tax=Andrographis paniculata TaxID=175694 RepID=UPI0021E7EF20|nr:cyclin-dependent protein kinase inhibitor SMR13-like [Andrographis paniculata]